MKDASEEEDDDFIASTSMKASSRKHEGRKSIAERQAGLRKMMDDDGM
jgi:hypothetical protein